MCGPQCNCKGTRLSRGGQRPGTALGSRRPRTMRSSPGMYLYTILPLCRARIMSQRQTGSTLVTCPRNRQQAKHLQRRNE